MGRGVVHSDTSEFEASDQHPSRHEEAKGADEAGDDLGFGHQLGASAGAAAAGSSF